MNNQDYWCDPVGTLIRLCTAVRVIARGQDNYRTRMDNATYALADLRPEDFPSRIRGRASRVLEVRRAVRQDYVTDALFHFERLSPKERAALLDDILCLYEACLLDIAADPDRKVVVYPNDR